MTASPRGPERHAVGKRRANSESGHKQTSAAARAPKKMAARAVPVGMALALSCPNERADLAKIAAALEALRESIAACELDIEALREELGAFAARIEAALAPERAWLGRIEAFLRHTERWLALLEEDDAAYRERRARAKALQQARAAQLAQAAQQSALAGNETNASDNAPSGLDDALPSALRAPTNERLKVAYRALARRYHPDLTEDETRRGQHSRMMAHVNALYHAGDWHRLEALQAQAYATQEAPPNFDGDDSWPARLAQARERLAWFAAVHEALQAEYAALVASPTYRLRQATRSTHRHQRPHAHMQAQLNASATRRLADIMPALAALEIAVRRDNGQQQPRRRAPLASQQTQALAPQFDARALQALSVLLGDAQALEKTSLATRRRAESLHALAAREPATARLVVLAYVVQLCAQPLPGLETAEGIAERFEAASHRDPQPLGFAEALIRADQWVSYGVAHFGQQSAQARLMLRDPQLAQAVPYALHDFALRRLFAQVLLHLGERGRCNACHRRIFMVPLYWLRGLEDIRALVCPHCGDVQRRYVMVRGDDIQAVLNPSYLALDIVHEMTLQLGRVRWGLQCLQKHAHTLTVGALRRRFAEDVLARHNLPIRAHHIRLRVQQTTLTDATEVSQLQGAALHVSLSPTSGWQDAPLLDELRYRVRTRFAAAAQ